MGTIRNGFAVLNMRRRKIEWKWEDPDAQQAFLDWAGGGWPSREASSSEVDGIERLADLSPPARILDVGCGNGRHALEFARRGYEVTGIDVAAAYLGDARAAASKEMLSIDFRLQRGAELRDEGMYDFALAFDHTLGFMADAELREHLSRIRMAIACSGSFLLVQAGPRVEPGQNVPRTQSWVERDGRFFLGQKEIVDGYRTEIGVVIDPESIEVTELHERQRAFTLDEVVAKLRSAGFATVDCLRDLEGNPATSRAFGVFLCRAP